MTRINLIPPVELTDRHLIAEYRELPRIFGLVLRAVLRGESPLDPKNPKEYTLGTGHLRFFYPRLTFCFNRYRALIDECVSRGFRVQYTEPDEQWKNSIPKEWWQDYKPTIKAIELNRSRIRQRLEEASKPR